MEGVGKDIWTTFAILFFSETIRSIQRMGQIEATSNWISPDYPIWLKRPKNKKNIKKVEISILRMGQIEATSNWISPDYPI